MIHFKITLILFKIHSGPVSTCLAIWAGCSSLSHLENHWSREMFLQPLSSSCWECIDVLSGVLENVLPFKDVWSTKHKFEDHQGKKLNEGGLIFKMLISLREQKFHQPFISQWLNLAYVPPKTQVGLATLWEWKLS